MRRFLSLLLVFVCVAMLSTPFASNAKTNAVKILSYSEDFDGIDNVEGLKEYWNLIDPLNGNVHQLVDIEGSKVLHMSKFSGLMWKEALGRYEFSADMKIDPANDKSTHGTGSALLVRVNRENMAGKPVYESYPEEGRQLGTSGIVIYLWQNNINITVRTFDEETNTVGPVVNFGNMRLPDGKDARNDFVNVKVADDGKGVIKIYLDDILYVTFTLSEAKELSDGTRTAVFYTKLKAEFSPDINFWDNKNVTEVNNAFVSASNGTISYATRNFGSYVGHYVDNIKMDIYMEFEGDTDADPVTWVDFTKAENVKLKYIEGKDMEATDGGAKINAEKGTFLYLRFPDEIVTDAANDYYLVIKYKYGDNTTTEKFFGGIILTSAAEREDYASINSGGMRYLQALGQTVNHTNIVAGDDGYYYLLVRISYNKDKLGTLPEDHAKVKYVRIELNDEADKIDELVIGGAAIYKDEYGFADNYQLAPFVPHAVPADNTDEETPNPPTGDAGLLITALLLSSVVLLKKRFLAVE